MRSWITTLALAAAMAASANAASAGEWTPLVAPNPAANREQPGLARDLFTGVLHVVWERQNALDPSREDLVHTGIDPRTGTASPPTTIVSSWSSVGLPDIAIGAESKLLVTIAGYTPELEPNLATAVSADGGASWAVDPSPLVRGPQEQPSLITGLDGTPFVAFGAVRVQRSFDRVPADKPDPSYDYQATLGGTDCRCGYFPDLARDPVSGAVWLGWFSLDAPRPGVYAEQVDTATGAPVGPPLLMPGSTTTYEGVPKSIAPAGRVAITGQDDTSTMFVAAAGGYPSPTKPLVWRVGSATATNLARAADRGKPVTAITVAAEEPIENEPGGFVWVVWSTGTGDNVRIHARRSNLAGTRWSAETVIRGPHDAVNAMTLDASPVTGKRNYLDVVARFSFADKSGDRLDAAPYVARLLPKLTLTATPARIRPWSTTRVRFRVTDAFVPVQNAAVTVGGKRVGTDARGEATVAVRSRGKGRSIVATADYVRHVSASVRIHVR